MTETEARTGTETAPAPGAVGTLAANLLLGSFLVRVCDLLARLGVPVCAIKGGALLPTVYAGDPESRPMNDVDVLIAPGRLHDAFLALRAKMGLLLIPDSGIELQPAPGEPGYGVLRLDLHDRLHFGGRRVARAVLGRAGRAPWNGGVIPVPDACDQLLEVVAHACLHQFALTGHPLEDIRRLVPHCEPAELRRRAATVRMSVPLALALEAAGCPAVTPQPHGLARCEEHFLRRRLAMRRPPGRSHLAYAAIHGDPRELAVHLVRRARFGPAAAQLLDAGIDPRGLAAATPGR